MLIATQLLCREVWSRGNVRFANRFLGQRLLCPCCGWKGRRFYDYIEVARTHRNAECPQCESHPRHRALILWLRRDYKPENKRGVALIFSPEKALASVWKEVRCLRVYRVDINTTRGVDFLADVQQMPVPANSIDLIWCHHVLEHVEDDRKAMKELHRIIRPATGELIVSVPMEVGSVTREYGSARKEESGHWRSYGDDFVDRLSECGFMVKPIAQNLSFAELVRYGLIHERYYVCTKPLQQTF